MSSQRFGSQKAVIPRVMQFISINDETGWFEINEDVPKAL
jgi:hypothetical protein